MAVLGSLAATIIGFTFPWNVVAIALIVWAGFRLSNYGVQVAVFTTAVALAWNSWFPNRDYNLLDLGINAVMAMSLLGVVR